MFLKTEDYNEKNKSGTLGRREFLAAGLAATAVSLLLGCSNRNAQSSQVK